MKKMIYTAARKSFKEGDLFIANGSPLEVRLVAIADTHVIVEDACWSFVKNQVPMSSFLANFRPFKGRVSGSGEPIRG